MIFVQLDDRSIAIIEQIVNVAVANTIKTLEEKNLLGKPSANDKVVKKTEKTAYQKTEQLLYSYMGFKRIVEEKKQEIADLRAYGVPQSNSVTEYVDKGGYVQGGFVLEEERVEAAVRTVEKSVERTVQAIALIDKCMASLKYDPYYKILEMRYFEGRTLEDIGVELGCDHTTISRNKSRLLKELSMKLFPDQTMSEMIGQ